MARKHKAVTIESEGRDKGKTFLVLEMPAMQAEKWAWKALLAMGRAGVEIPEDVLSAGAIGVLLLGFAGMQRLPFEDAEPLLDEMSGCFSFVPDVGKTDQTTGRPYSRPLIASADGADIEEVATLLKLRGEAVELHVGFSMAAVLSNLAAALSSNRPDTSTFPASSAELSQADAPA